MNKIITTRKLPFEFPSNFVTLEKGRAPTHQEILAVDSNAVGLISTLEDKINRELLEKMPKLKIVAQFAVGTNNIDLAYCRERGIAVTNTPLVLTEATAELSFSLLQAVARQFRGAISNAAEGKWIGWEPMGFLGKALKGKNLGVIGAGRIGKRAAEMARGAYNMNIMYHNRSRDLDWEKSTEAQYKSLDEILSQSDAIILLCPLTPETRGMIGKEQLLKMKKDAILINVARGEIIVQDDLVDVLKSGHLFGVGLDVTTPEPLPKDHPLFQIERVLILPHIGSATTEARYEMAKLCFENCCAVLENRSLLTSVL